ncbi:MAG: pirin family protein [Ginsengibacter sp.]
MIFKIENNKKVGNPHIKILYPGKAMGTGDSGFASIGRIDHASLPPGAFIAMHPHINDEILSYFRSGKVKHTDSAGFSEYITPSRLMLMKAGHSFFHEEKILDDSELLEGLQIFIRPKSKDLKPEVTFYELPEVYSKNKWRLLAGPNTEAPLRLTSDTWIYDIQITGENEIELPLLSYNNLTFLLYIFQGSAVVNNLMTLSKGESIILKDEENISIHSSNSEMVLFVTDESAPFFDGGMYSGNQNNS